MFKYVKFEKVENGTEVSQFNASVEDVEVFSFDVDVVSLSCEDEDKIDELIAMQDEAINCEVIDKDEFKTLVENSAQVKRVYQRAEEHYNKSVSVLTSKYPLAERETWALQLKQAEKFKESDDEDDAPFLKALADAEGGTVANFADAVISKAQSYENFMAQALSQKRAYKRDLLEEVGI